MLNDTNGTIITKRKRQHATSFFCQFQVIAINTKMMKLHHLIKDFTKYLLKSLLSSEYDSVSDTPYPCEIITEESVFSISNSLKFIKLHSHLWSLKIHKINSIFREINKLTVVNFVLLLSRLFLEVYLNRASVLVSLLHLVVWIGLINLLYFIFYVFSYKNINSVNIILSFPQKFSKNISSCTW